VPAIPVGARWDLSTVLLWMLVGYIVLLTASDLILRWQAPGAASHEFKLDRGRFVVISALTLTGFQSSTGIDSYTAFGRYYIFLLTLIGSIFTMTFAGLCVVRIVRLRFSDRQVTFAGAIVCLGLTLIGGVPLLSSHPPLDAFMFSAGAFGNSGLFFGRLPGIMSWQLFLIILPLAVLGSLGLPVLMELSDVIRMRGGLCDYSRRVLRLSAGVFLVGFIIFTAVRYFSPDTSLSDAEQTARFYGANAIAAINSRTLGLPYAVRGMGGEVSFVREFTPLMLWMLIPFMVIGGCPAGTAGGMKITTFAEIFRGVRRSLRGQSPGRSFGIAAAWLGIYAFLVVLFFTLLMFTVDHPTSDRVLFETISALSNVGLSYDRIQHHTPPLDIMSGAMLLGRLAPLCILWWMATSTTDAELPIG